MSYKVIKSHSIACHKKVINSHSIESESESEKLYCQVCLHTRGMCLGIVSANHIKTLKQHAQTHRVTICGAISTLS